MDFDFTQEQQMLRRSGARVSDRESAAAGRARQLMEDAVGYSEPTWRQMAEMGLLGIAIAPARRPGAGA